MKITALEHVVITVIDFERIEEFYTGVLGMELLSFDDNKKLSGLAGRR